MSISGAGLTDEERGEAIHIPCSMKKPTGGRETGRERRENILRNRKSEKARQSGERKEEKTKTKTVGSEGV